jgi:hypothetical protein
VQQTDSSGWSLEVLIRADLRDKVRVKYCLEAGSKGNVTKMMRPLCYCVICSCTFAVTPFCKVFVKCLEKVLSCAETGWVKGCLKGGNSFTEGRYYVNLKQNVWIPSERFCTGEARGASIE